MKVFLVIIACLQSTVTPLQDSCVLIPMKENFETIPQCFRFVDYFKYQVKSTDPDMFITGFCTSKETTST
jgi:hypothetical protein